MAYKVTMLVHTQGDSWSPGDVSNMIEWGLGNVDRATVTVKEVVEVADATTTG